MSSATYAITDEAGLVVWLEGRAVLSVPPECLVELAARALKAHTQWQARHRCEAGIRRNDPWEGA